MRLILRNPDSLYFRVASARPRRYPGSLQPRSGRVARFPAPGQGQTSRPPARPLARPRSDGAARPRGPAARRRSGLVAAARAVLQVAQRVPGGDLRLAHGLAVLQVTDGVLGLAPGLGVPQVAQRVPGRDLGLAHGLAIPQVLERGLGLASRVPVPQVAQRGLGAAARLAGAHVVECRLGPPGRLGPARPAQPVKQPGPEAPDLPFDVTHGGISCSVPVSGSQSHKHDITQIEAAPNSVYPRPSGAIAAPAGRLAERRPPGRAASRAAVRQSQACSHVSASAVTPRTSRCSASPVPWPWATGSWSPAPPRCRLAAARPRTAPTLRPGSAWT